MTKNVFSDYSTEAEAAVQVAVLPVAMSIQQVAAATSLSKRTVESLLSAGMLPCLRVGSANSDKARVLIPTKELVAWLTEHIGQRVELPVSEGVDDDG